MVILVICQTENEKQGDFFVLFSPSKIKQSPVGFHCTVPCGLHLCLARSFTAGAVAVRFMYHHGLYIRVGETHSSVEEQNLGGVYSGSACGSRLSVNT